MCRSKTMGTMATLDPRTYFCYSKMMHGLMVTKSGQEGNGGATVVVIFTPCSFLLGG